MQQVNQAVKRVCNEKESYQEVTKEEDNNDGDLLMTASRNIGVGYYTNIQSYVILLL